MAKEGKKLIRAAFRNAVFKRDGYKCVTCSFKSSPDKAEQDLDAHHLIPREDLPGQGYVLSNGISLCSECHIKAEEFYATGKAQVGFSPDELLKAVGSDLDSIFQDCEKLIKE